MSQPPRGLTALVAWFAEAWRDETPDRLHVAGVWREYGRDAVGASALGAPRYADPFRNYLEASPFQTDADGRFIRPMHALVAAISGRDPDAERAFHGRFLFTLACRGFDWRSAAAALAIPRAVAIPYAEWVLRLAYRRYRDEPPARVLRAA